MAFLNWHGEGNMLVTKLHPQTWWHHQMETFSALLALCVGNSLVTGEFLSQRLVMWSFDVFFDLCLNIRLSKQSWGWGFEMPSRSLWHHCNEATAIYTSAKVSWLSLDNKKSLDPHWLDIYPTTSHINLDGFTLLAQPTRYSTFENRLYRIQKILSKSAMGYVEPHFYPRPVLAFGYCRCLRLSVCPSVRVCGNHLLVRAITHYPF